MACGLAMAYNTCMPPMTKATTCVLNKQGRALRPLNARCAMQTGMSTHSAAEPGLDASDIDAGWDLIGDLREALPEAATNGASAGARPYPCLV